MITGTLHGLIETCNPDTAVRRPERYRCSRNVIPMHLAKLTEAHYTTSGGEVAPGYLPALAVANTNPTSLVRERLCSSIGRTTPDPCTTLVLSCRRMRIPCDLDHEMVRFSMSNVTSIRGLLIHTVVFWPLALMSVCPNQPRGCDVRT